MKRILITLVALTMFVSVAFGGYCETKAFALVPNITGGVFHGSTACTTDLYDYLYGANFARFTLHGDTIVDTVSYYFFELQSKPVAGASWGASVPIGVDSITLNSEGTYAMVSDTLDLGGPEVFLMTYGSHQLSRVIAYPTVLTAKQGMKNCTLYVTRYKQ